MENYYLDKNVTKSVTYKAFVKECPETRLPIWKYEFYLKKIGRIAHRWNGSNNAVDKGYFVNENKLVVTINSYMSYDDIWLMEELILNEY
jgi:hypothetical protein